MNTPNIDYPGSVATFVFSVVNADARVASFAWLALCVAWCASLYYFAVKKTYVRSNGSIVKPGWQGIAMAMAGVLLLRLPNLILPEQNVDESQWIANAGTFYNGAVLWKGVSGYSGGPLLFVPLCVMNVLQLGLSYATARLFGLLFCVLPSVWLAWLILKRWFNASVAFLLVTPLALFFAFAYTFDMIAYNSEHVPMLLIAWSAYLLFTLRLDANGFRSGFFLLGCVLGLLPWAKLQALPIGFAVGILALYDVVISRHSTGRKGAFTLQLISGALLPTLLFFVYLLANGAVQSFYDDYILGNLLYAGAGMGDHRSGLARFFVFIPMFRNTHDARMYYISVALLVAVAVVTCYKKVRAAGLVRDKRVVFSFLIAAAALFTVTVPGNANLFHYQILFVVPAALFAGALTGCVLEQNGFALTKSFKILYACVLLLPLAWTAKEGNRAIAFVKQGGNLNVSATSEAIRGVTVPNEKMAVWGWAEKYYVETGLVQSHAQPHPHIRIFETQTDNPYLEAYVTELKQNNPAVFLDAVAPGSFFYRAPKFQHENYPALRDCINERYTLTSEHDGLRVYTRNDKMLAPLLNRPR